MATIAPPLICPQGHGPGVPGSRFCTFCGATLVAPLAPGQPVPTSPATAPPPANGGWQPVNTGPAQAMPAGPTQQRPHRNGSRRQQQRSNRPSGSQRP